ncbi:hypothetical protein [Bradyrhizobium sp. LHD-71]|uniref:TolB family protein n=1 Tax=Bradyrhizobium sp. LHD-71 TaxID=3072141 RepID=UPI00280CDC86|nr:hypothetical protein [Bradyrhizobium sp. LHD-71]MDQ8727181.1 hypothetical protein [Bradyrhizobium sp. LHD-71]
MAPAFASPVFLMNYPQAVSDYRCVVDAQGSQLIFERSTDGGQFNLKLLDLSTPNAEPVAFAPSLQLSTRPDWSWSSGQVAFDNGRGIWTAGGDGSNLQLLEGTADMIYPAWYPQADAMVVMNGQSTANPQPCSSEIDPNGSIVQAVMANDTVWAGMPSVNPTNANQIVFAGQFIGDQKSYNQDRNYIWFADRSTDPVTVRPLDRKAPSGSGFKPAFQGRAPWWSPDGKWVVFESDRSSAEGLYAIFIQDSAGENPAVQVTDCKWNANHAKWFPCGTKLVVSVLQSPPNRPRGIASLDVSPFVG